MQNQLGKLCIVRYLDLVASPRQILKAIITNSCDISGYNFDLDSVRTHKTRKAHQTRCLIT